MKPSLLHDRLRDYDVDKIFRDFDFLGAQQFRTMQFKLPSEFFSTLLVLGSFLTTSI